MGTSGTKRFLIGLLAVVAAWNSPVWPKSLLLADRAMGFRLGVPSQDDAFVKQQVQQALSLARENGMDVRAWRDAVEDRLTALGPAALGILEIEAERRRGYELDALQVALFRIRNDPIRPREVVADWVRRQAGKPDDAAVVHMGHLAVPPALFPHHLFYAVAPGRGWKRAVVAVAADGKVQPLPDDAALQRFFRTELSAVRGEPAMARVSAAAALLAVGRATTPDDVPPTADEFRDRSAKSTLSVEGKRIAAEATFDPSGRLLTLTTRDASVPDPATKPAVLDVPNPVAPPPPMPG